jgi:hypothetical protein
VPEPDQEAIDPSAVVDFKTLSGFVDPEAEYAGDRSIGRSRIARWILGDGAGMLDPSVEIQAKLRRTALPHRPGEALGGATGVGPHSAFPAFADLDSGRRQLDQSFERIGHRAPAPLRVPEPFPDFVSFPVVSGVEKRHASEKLARAGERDRADRLSG